MIASPFSSFMTSDRSLLPGTRDIHSQVKFIVLILLSLLFFYSASGRVRDLSLPSCSHPRPLLVNLQMVTKTTRMKFSAVSIPVVCIARVPSLTSNSLHFDLDNTTPTRAVVCFVFWSNATISSPFLSSFISVLSNPLTRPNRVTSSNL